MTNFVQAKKEIRKYKEEKAKGNLVETELELKLQYMVDNDIPSKYLFVSNQNEK